MRREFEVPETDLSPFAQAFLRLERGDVDGSRAIWDAAGYADAPWSNTHVGEMLFALADGNRGRAEAELQAARSAANERNMRAWMYLGAALLDPENFEEQIANERLALDVAPTAADWDLGANINYIQYLSLALQRQYLPQVGYTEADPVLLHLLGSVARRAYP